VNTAAIPAELIESELFGHEKGAFTGAVARHIGKFEQAAGGTLFLDEIGDMPMQAQTRLLRALQSGSIRRVGGREEVRTDVRIIAATNKDLKPQIAAGLFREDLYYRLNVVPIQMPPLRDRPEDIEALARHFLIQAAGEGLPRRTLSEDAADLLSRQTWRGNVRELRNFIYRLALLARDNRIDAATVADMLESEPLDASVPAGQGPDLASAVRLWLEVERPPDGTIYDEAVAALERPLFAAVLSETGGNQLRAASLLGINRNTLRKRLSELELDPDRFSSRQ
jgi:two-component system nitrogen regulation response regulator GlnG